MQTYNLYSWHRPCWKCERSTPRVIATNPEYEFNAMDVDDDLGKAMGKRFDSLFEPPVTSLWSFLTVTANSVLCGA